MLPKLLWRLNAVSHADDLAIVMFRRGTETVTNLHLVGRQLRETATLALVGVCIISCDSDTETVIITVSEGGGGTNAASFRLQCSHLGTLSLAISEDLNLSFSTVHNGKKECVEYQVSLPPPRPWRHPTSDPSFFLLLLLSHPPDRLDRRLAGESKTPPSCDSRHPGDRISTIVNAGPRSAGVVSEQPHLPDV